MRRLRQRDALKNARLPFRNRRLGIPYCWADRKAVIIMSVAEIPSRVAQPPAERYAPVDRPARFAITLEHVAYFCLFALALLTHLWGLGDRALHHDETLHAAYSWRLYTGQGFAHDPLLHGPFLYHITALMYFLFGDNDFTARLSVALFGSALVVMPFLIRRELGRGRLCWRRPTCCCRRHFCMSAASFATICTQWCSSC